MNDSSQRTGYHHGALRAALINAALDVLDEGGADRVTVRETARRAGVSPAAPFRHFADRQALLAAVTEAVLTDFTEHQRTAAETADSLSFRAFGLAFIRYATAHPHRFELLKTALHQQPSPVLASLETYLNELIIAGQQAGELRPHDPATLRIAGHALVYGLSQMIVDGLLPPETAESVLDLFGLGILDL